MQPIVRAQDMEILQLLRPSQALLLTLMAMFIIQ